MAPGLNVHVPFYVATTAIVLAVGVLATGHSLLTQAELRAEEAAAPQLAQPLAGNGRVPVIAAIDGSSDAARVTRAAIELARQRGCPGEIVHVMETDIVGEQAVDAETPEAAAEVTARSVSLLREAAVPGSGHLLRVAGDHGASDRTIAEFARGPAGSGGRGRRAARRGSRRALRHGADRPADPALPRPGARCAGRSQPVSPGLRDDGHRPAAGPHQVNRERADETVASLG